MSAEMRRGLALKGYPPKGLNDACALFYGVWAAGLFTLELFVTPTLDIYSLIVYGISAAFSIVLIVCVEEFSKAGLENNSIFKRLSFYSAAILFIIAWCIIYYLVALAMKGLLPQLPWDPWQDNEAKKMFFFAHVLFLGPVITITRIFLSEIILHLRARISKTNRRLGDPFLKWRLIDYE